MLKTLPQFRETARSILATPVFDYIAGGTETEHTLRRNRASFDRLVLRPRVLVDVSEIKLSTALFGYEASMPLMIAPLGDIGLAHPDGAIAVARAAQDQRIPAIISVQASHSLAEIRRAAPSAALIFQIYPFGPVEWHHELIELARAAGCLALCVTLDTPVYGRRERDLLNGFTPRQGAQPNWRRHIAPADQARATWESLQRICELSEMPVIAKGILDPGDATLALEAGADAVYLSNHGGRRLDYAPAALEVVPSVQETMNGRAALIVDGGIERGSDVIKAIAQGASVAAIGRLAAWGIAVEGARGLGNVLDLMRDEMETVLSLMGKPSISSLASSDVAGRCGSCVAEVNA